MSFSRSLALGVVQLYERGGAASAMPPLRATPKQTHKRENNVQNQQPQTKWTFATVRRKMFLRMRRKEGTLRPRRQQQKAPTPTASLFVHSPEERKL